MAVGALQASTWVQPPLFSTRPDWVKLYPAAAQMIDAATLQLDIPPMAQDANVRSIEQVRSSDRLHDRDFYSWTQQQADLLRGGRFESLDIANLIEEIETLGRSERSALQSAYRLIAMHLLKMMVQPGRYSRSWYITVMRERVNAARILDENPGLKPMRAELFASGYADARKDAAAETGLAREAFPLSPPFTLDEAHDDFFLPAEVRERRPGASD